MCIRDSVDTNINTYNSFVKNATILISTNGFGGSVPWKLVEFLKLGSCIVAERNKHLLRGPLTKNQVSFFDNLFFYFFFFIKYIFLKYINN